MFVLICQSSSPGHQCFMKIKSWRTFFEQGLFGLSLNIKNDQDKQKPPIKKQTCIETFKSYPPNSNNNFDVFPTISKKLTFRRYSFLHCPRMSIVRRPSVSNFEYWINISTFEYNAQRDEWNANPLAYNVTHLKDIHRK